MGFKKFSVVVLSIAAFGLVAACAPPSTPPAPAVDTPTVRIPAIPLPPAQSYAVSPSAIDALGCEECATGGAPDAARFFYGRLPLASVDSILAGTSTDHRATLGSLFASGYFGGIHLRGLLGGGVAGDVAPFAPLLDQLGALTQVGLDSVVGGLVQTATSGSDADVRNAAGAWAAILSAIDGYNRGYLDTLLQHPPSGVTAPSVSCASFFDCRSASLPLAALDQLAQLRTDLNLSPDLTWAQVSLLASTIAAQAKPAGEAVWNQLLSSATFAPGSYASIVDLSVGFLEVTQAALLADLAGPTNGDITVARHGLVATAALVTWAGSYVLGLASSLPDGAQPTLTCA